MGFDFDQVIVWSKNNFFRDKAFSFFDKSGVEVKPVINPEEVILFAEKKETSLVIIGFSNDSPDPFFIISKLKSLNENNKIVVLSSGAGVETAVKFIKSGVEDFLILPDTDEELCDIFSKLIKKEVAQNIESKKDSLDVLEGKTLICEDARMKKVLDLAKQIAKSRAPVFLSGESGTGKEVIARHIHEISERTGPFIGVNCAALPETLLESSLFGHEKGAFTGAVSRKPGKFELAHNGTLLLDEITEMPVYLQAKLLRVLQEGEIDRLGGVETVKVDVRIIAATNREPAECLKSGDFRNDLYHRINTIPIKIPPLRQRPEDVKALSNFFVKKYNEIDATTVKGLTQEAIEKLLGFSFNGNVRELENIIRRAALICSGDLIGPGDIILAEEFGTEDYSVGAENIEGSGFSPKPLREIEKEIIFKTLNETEGNRTHAAELLGISVRTLRNKLNSYKAGMELP